MEKSYKKSKIKSIDIETNEDVFDITVEDNHNFFANGILVHNCVEIGMRSCSFCNLSEVNGSNIVSQQDLEERAKGATLIGTCQASFTNFHYLRSIWRENAEEEAILGVSITGVASTGFLSYDIKKASLLTIEENKRVASLIGINPAHRITCNKPSGTTSILLGTSSGIHAWHNDYYIRRVTVGKKEAIYSYLQKNHPYLLEDNPMAPEIEAKICYPQKAPDGAINRQESALQTLDRVKYMSDNWVRPTFLKGENSHNVSCTISVKPDEWKDVGEWMWKNKDSFNGIATLPFDGGTYVSLPFEDITKKEYERRVKELKFIDVTQIIEEEDGTDLSNEVACGGGACEIK